MFKYLNIDNMNFLTLMVSNTATNESLEIPVHIIASKRNKEELSDEKQFHLINSFLNYKGTEFKTKLFEVYKKNTEELTKLVMNASGDNFIEELFVEIFDMFDLDDILNYIRNVYMLPCPNTIHKEFTQEDSNKKTKEQTYIISEYEELVAFSTLMRLVLPLIGQFTLLKQNDKDLLAINTVMIFASTKQFESPAVIRLKEYIEFTLNSMSSTRSEAELVISKNIPMSVLKSWVFSHIIIKVLPFGSFVKDDSKKNIVTKMYKIIGDLIKPSPNVATAVRDKNIATGAGSGNEESKESALEQIRKSTSHVTALPQDLEYFLSDMDTSIAIMKRKHNVVLDKDLIMNIYKQIKNRKIADIQVSLLGNVVYSLIHPFGLRLLENKDTIYRLLAIGFVYLWTIDNKYLAYLLVAEIEKNAIMANGVKKGRLTLKEELYKAYGECDENYTPVVDNITYMTDKFFDNVWVTTLDESFLSHIEHNNRYIILQTDTKNILANYYITHIK